MTERELIDADPAELRKVAAFLARAGEFIANETGKVGEEWLFLSDHYRDPQSKVIGDTLKRILLEIQRLNPKVDDASRVFRAYADWLERG